MNITAGHPTPGRIAPDATEHVRVPLAISGADPTGHPVNFAVTDWESDDSPEAAAWRPGEWDDGAAQCLIGASGALNPGPGRWSVWVEVTAPPEVAVRRARGSIIIR